jgi:hypothetical protein
VEWIRKLFRRESAPPAPPEPTSGINPAPAETALHWSAEDQQSGEGHAADVQEGDEPKPKRTL